MPTLFRLIPKEAKLNIDNARFQQTLPASMQLEERDDGTYIQVTTEREEDPSAQYQVDRELDRLFFLTCVRVRAVMCTKSIVSDLGLKWSIHGILPPSIERQNWTYNLAAQLRLWAIASEIDDPPTKIVLLFQVIELAYPAKNNYPRYLNSTIPPHPRTECKLLRHLVVHAGDVDSQELKNYCDYLELPQLMLDRTDRQHIDALAAKVNLLELEAKAILQSALSQETPPK